VPVRVIVGSLAERDTPEQIRDAYPQQTNAELKTALKFGAKAVNNPGFIPYTASAASERIPNATL
jgi:uncharacterized protein (DUF433 family)